MWTDPTLPTVPCTQEEKCLPPVPYVRLGGKGGGRASTRCRQPETRQGHLLLDWTLLCAVHLHLRLRIGDAGHHGAGRVQHRQKAWAGPRRCTETARPAPGTWGYVEPGGATFWLENLPRAAWPFGASFYPSIRTALLTSFREECGGPRLPDAVTLGEFLLPECYVLGAPSPLEIGIANFSQRPTDWDKAVFAPPPS